MSTSFDLDTMICVVEIFTRNESTLKIIAWVSEINALIIETCWLCDVKSSVLGNKH